MKNKEYLEIIKMALQYYYQSIYNGYTGNTKECRDANNHLLEKIKDTAKYIEKINEYEDLEEEYNKLGINMLSFLKTNLDMFKVTDTVVSLTEEDKKILGIK